MGGRLALKYMNTYTHTHTNTYSYVDGQLGCGYRLVIVNNSAMNVGVQVPNEHGSADIYKTVILLPLGIHPKVGLLDLMVVLCSFFEQPSRLFPWWLYRFTFPPTVHKGSDFSHLCAYVFIPFNVVDMKVLLIRIGWSA